MILYEHDYTGDIQGMTQELVASIDTRSDRLTIFTHQFHPRWQIINITQKNPTQTISNPLNAQILKKFISIDIKNIPSPHSLQIQQSYFL
jgi:hypothetical protein